MFRHIAISYEI